MSEFALLDAESESDWAEWSLDNATNDAGLVRLRQERLPAYVDPRTIVELPATASPIVDVDVDHCDILYLLRESGDIERYDADADRLERLGCTGVGPPDAPARSLSVGRDTIYVGSGAGSGADGYVTAVAKAIEQTRWTATASAATPVAMADDGGRVFVLFETADGGHLDLVEPSGEVRPAVEGLSGPIDIAVDADRTGYVLDQLPEKTVIRTVEIASLDPESPVSTPDTWDVSLPSNASSLAAGESDELLIGRRGVAEGEVTTLRLGVSAHEPIASMDREIDRLHLAEDLYAVEAGGLVVHQFDARPVYAEHEKTGEQTAWLTKRFDSGEQATAWHRVTMGFSTGDAALQIRLEYAATDDPIPQRRVEWTEIDPPNPHDALLSDAEGRYLWLRIELQGDRFTTPRLRTLRAYFPRKSYLRYLPAIYQEDPESRAFLEQFLSIFESTFDGVEEDLAHITRYLDPAGVPPEFLDWLESWLALDPDETWPEPARRELLSQASDLFKGRGTPNGLLALLRIYLDEVADPSDGWQTLRKRQLEDVDEREAAGLSPADAWDLRRRIESDVFLLEYSDLDCVRGETRDAFTRLLDCPQCFFVFVRPFVTDEQFDAIQRLVDETRPAHAVGRAVELEPSIVLGGHAYLGVNSVLPDREMVVGEGSLGRDSVLDTHEAAGQLAVRARLGEDTELS